MISLCACWALPQSQASGLLRFRLRCCFVPRNRECSRARYSSAFLPASGSAREHVASKVAELTGVANSPPQNAASGRDPSDCGMRRCASCPHSVSRFDPRAPEAVASFAKRLPRLQKRVPLGNGVARPQHVSKWIDNLLCRAPAFFYAFSCRSSFAAELRPRIGRS